MLDTIFYGYICYVCIMYMVCDEIEKNNISSAKFSAFSVFFMVMIVEHVCISYVMKKTMMRWLNNALYDVISML